MSNSLSVQHGVPALVAAYDEAVLKIRECYAMAEATNKMVESVFSHENEYAGFRVLSSNDWRLREEQVDQKIEELTRYVWKFVLGKMGFRRMACAKRYQDTMKAIEEGRMPPFNEKEILDILIAFSQNGGEMMEETVRGAFEIVRLGVHNSDIGRMKTNQKNARFDVGAKVVVPWLASRFSRFYDMRLSEYREQDAVEVDRAFHLLDGKGIPAGYVSPLADAINTVPKEGETEYFSFKKYKNGNLHLCFKRPDLLREFNRIGSGGAAVLKG